MLPRFCVTVHMTNDLLLPKYIGAELLAGHNASHASPPDMHLQSHCGM